MQQPPGFPPGGGGYGPPPGGGYGPPQGGGGQGPPPGGSSGSGYGPPPGGGYGPPPGGYGGPPGGGFGGPPGGGYGGPPPGGGYGGPPPGGGYGGPPPGGFGGPPMGMPPQAPKKDGPSAAVIALIGLVLAGVLGLGGCMLCIFVGRSSDTPSPTAAGVPQNTPLPATPAPAEGTWITSERPFVKFLSPAGWNKDLKGDWGVFTSKDGAAVFAFTTFNQPGESTARLGKAAWVLGVDDIQWGSPTAGNVGKDNFKARMGEGTCRFNGPGGYIWYATVDPGTADQILLIYTVSAAGGKVHKDAVLGSIRSLQRRP